MRILVPAIVLLSVFLPGAAAQAPRELRLTFVGDIMGHDVNYHMADFTDIYRGVRDALLDDDLTFANLELPVDPSRAPAGYPLFNGSAAYLRAPIESGVDVLSVANNHAFDGGVEGIFQTIRSLHALRDSRGRPLAYSGTRGNAHRAFLPASLVVNGVRVGFLAVAQFLNEPDQGRYVNVVDYQNEAAVRDLLKLVKSLAPQYDLFIVSYHGDREYVQEPSPLKRAFFRQLLDAGAHIVFGHHPHVVQGYRMIRVGDSDRLIMYSMGNFISGMTWNTAPSQLDGALAATGESFMLRVGVRCTAGGCTVSGVEPVPIANYPNERQEMIIALMSGLADGSVRTSASWRAYYDGRLALMRLFLSRAAAPPPAAK